MDRQDADAERTEVIYGEENVTEMTLQFASNAKARIECCVDSTAVTVAAGVPEFRQAIASAVERGVKLRYITEITKDNLAYCREFAKSVELRHLDDIKGNFAVNEVESISTATITQKAKPVPKAIYSNIREVVQQQEYLFETLWSRAAPAEKKIREIEEGRAAERTLIIGGLRETTDAILQVIRNAKTKMDGCGDQNAPPRILGFEPYRKVLLDAKNRGVKMRIITDITRDNLEHSKELLKLFPECRHLEGMKINNGISDNEYVASVISEAETVPYPQVIYSNSREIVEEQNYVFEALWKKATPAGQRIAEIEEGILPSETKVLEEPKQVYDRIVELLGDSKEVMVASTAGGLYLIHNQFFDIYKKLMAKKAKDEHKGIRWAMFIDKDSINIIRKFLDIGVEVRHVRNMPAMYFSLSDKIYNGTIETMEGGKMIQTLLTSTEPAYLQHFKSAFEGLWSEGIDAADRIKEIEAGSESETEIVNNPRRTEQIYKQMIDSANQEIMVILPSTFAFKREERIGIISLLERAARRGVTVRILLTSFRAGLGEEEEKKITRLEEQGIKAQLLSRALARTEEGIGRVKVIVADNKKSLVIEVRDDTKDVFAEAVGPALVLTQRSLVSSFSRIFESLWMETEVAMQLEESDRLQKEFINIAAHELRTPVQPILGMADLIESALGSNEKTEVTREDIAMIVRNAKRLERLSSDILEVARMESRSLELHKERFSLDDVISDVIKNALGESGNGKAKVDYSPSNVFVYADKAKIAQVVHNLLSNAIKFTPHGSISIRAEENGGQVAVAVKDTGKGIDPGIASKLFSKFATKSEKGTGLGLYISKKIVEAHGGKIRGENNKDKGATFTFSLPAN